MIAIVKHTPKMRKELICLVHPKEARQTQNDFNALLPKLEKLRGTRYELQPNRA